MARYNSRRGSTRTTRYSRARPASRRRAAAPRPRARGRAGGTQRIVIQVVPGAPAAPAGFVSAVAPPVRRKF